MKTRTRIITAVLVAIVLAAAPAVWLLRERQRLYKVTVLPSLGGKGMGATAINDRGQVVGLAATKDGQRHLYLWDRRTGIQDLGPAEARFDINNAGQICGTIVDPAGNAQAFLRDPDKGIILLGTLGGKTSRAWALNNRGQVAGVSETAAGFHHAFFWDPTQGMQDLGTFGGNESQSRAINDAGEVFGLADFPQREFCPFIWDPNLGKIPLDPYLHRGPGRRFWPLDINNKGAIVGVLFSKNMDCGRAVLLEPIPERWRKQPAQQKSRGRSGVVR